MHFTLGNPKILKGQKKGYLSAVLHLAPADTSGIANVCPAATPAARRCVLIQRDVEEFLSRASQRT